MDLSLITPVILAYNEEVNLLETLNCLKWAKRVVVVDSFSTDRTKEIACSSENVSFFERKFDCHRDQWNFGVEQVESPWVLSLDSDYRVTEELIEEMKTISSESKDGFYISFIYAIRGNLLRGTVLPPRMALFRKEKGCYIQDGHTQLLELNGEVGYLQEKIIHDDRKSFSRWIHSQLKYADLECERLNEPNIDLALQDKIRKQIWIAPWLLPLYCLLVKGVIWNGWNGVQYALERGLAESILAWKLIEKKLS